MVQQSCHATISDPASFPSRSRHDHRYSPPLRQPTLKSHTTHVIRDGGVRESLGNPRVTWRSREQLVNLQLRQRAVVILLISFMSRIPIFSTNLIVRLEDVGKELVAERTELNRAI